MDLLDLDGIPLSDLYLKEELTNIHEYTFMTGELPDFPINDITETYCMICGDASTGRHYGVVSCDGCKGFFKRAVEQKGTFQCNSGTNNCLISKDTRNQCRACRLRACLSFGMKTDAVQSKRENNSVMTVHYAAANAMMVPQLMADVSVPHYIDLDNPGQINIQWDKPAQEVVKSLKPKPSFLGTCTVCGDRATGKHYKTICCDGCKGFFRRAVRENAQYNCCGHPFRDCNVSGKARTKCRRCRLNKCLVVGMDPKMVQGTRDRIRNKLPHQKAFTTAP